MDIPIYCQVFSALCTSHTSLLRTSILTDSILFRPNYLVYVNTLLFYRVGGETRVSGFMLAGATTLLLLVGTSPIAFIRTSLLLF